MPVIILGRSRRKKMDGDDMNAGLVNIYKSEKRITVNKLNSIK